MSQTRTFERWFDDGSIVFTIEWLGGLPFIHLQLSLKWSPLVKERVALLRDALRADLGKRGHKWLFAYNTKQDDKWRKFVELMGFTKSFVHDGLDVYWIRNGN